MINNKNTGLVYNRQNPVILKTKPGLVLMKCWLQVQMKSRNLQKMQWPEKL